MFILHLTPDVCSFILKKKANCILLYFVVGNEIRNVSLVFFPWQPVMYLVVGVLFLYSMKKKSLLLSTYNRLSRGNVSYVSTYLHSNRSTLPARKLEEHYSTKVLIDKGRSTLPVRKLEEHYSTKVWNDKWVFPIRLQFFKLLNVYYN